MRVKVIAGNWKMHASKQAARDLLQTLVQGVSGLKGQEVIVFPSFVHLQLAQDLLAGSAIGLGAQNLYLGDFGAFTGEVSGVMLKDYGCQFVLIGHSERRQVFGESLALTAQKFQAAQSAGLTPILCLGETQAEREAGKTEQVLTEQLVSVIKAMGISAFDKAILAYEPVWAIGTGLTATPDQAQTAHAFIRAQLAQYSIEVAAAMRILYGGSVKASNAAELFAMPDVDGGLVGGASLVAEQFLDICRAAHSLKV